MNKRVIINVATGDFYCKKQQRLTSSFTRSVVRFHNGKDIDPLPLPNDSCIDLMIWTDELPIGSRPHSESPYGFKIHAFKAAYEMGYTSILWLDSPAFAVKEDISPIFDKIEKEGYYAMSHIDPLENWVGDHMLNVFNIKRESLRGLNLPSGSCYGFDLSNPIAEGLFDWMASLEKNDLFKSQAISEGKWHRHDEAALALSLIWIGKKVFTFDPLFQSDSPECVIKSGGE